MSSGDKKRNRGDRPELLPGEVHEEAGPFPDNFQEMWNQCKPDFISTGKVLVMGTMGPETMNHFKDVFNGKTQEEKDTDQQQ